MQYNPSETRYDKMPYNRCGKSGILLPKVSLGLWHNFGSVDDFENGRKMIHRAFDCGVTHFDLANNYGPVPGSAEENFGKILKQDFGGYMRDELIISTKAGYRMWPGPYGEWGSRKYLLSSLDQSLKRMGIPYVDIFYSHRPDPNTSIEETMMALDHAVRSGRALYAGISSYNAKETRVATSILNDLGTPCLIHQPNYSMFDRWIEGQHGQESLLDVLEEYQVGCIAFSPLSQGLLTNKYIKGIPENSRAAKSSGHLQESEVTPEKIKKVQHLQQIAESRGQSLAQMALAWVLRDERITTVLIGASSVGQLDDNLDCLQNLEFTNDQLNQIEGILK